MHTCIGGRKGGAMGSGIATLGPTGALAPPSTFVPPPSRPFSLYHVIQLL